MPWALAKPWTDCSKPLDCKSLYLSLIHIWMWYRGCNYADRYHFGSRNNSWKDRRLTVHCKFPINTDNRCFTVMCIIIWLNEALTVLSCAVYLLQSLTLADPALHTKWYNTNKKIANNLKIIFQRVKTPVLMTAFRSPNFDLSKGTFLVVRKL